MSFPNCRAGRISLPEGDQVWWASDKIVAQDVFPGGDLQAERCPCVPCAQVPCHVVAKAAAVRDCAGAAVWLQSADGRSRAPDLQHAVPDCGYVHWHHHIGSVQALPDGAY